jgi:hypothetical protein
MGKKKAIVKADFPWKGRLVHKQLGRIFSSEAGTSYFDGVARTQQHE